MFKGLLHLSKLLLGVLGVALCMAVAFVVWRVGERMNQANDRVFEVVDTALVAGRDRLLDAERRVQDAKITTEDVRQGVEAWARREVPQRIASRPEVELTIERLALGLQHVDRGLEISGTSLLTVQQALGLARSLDAPVDPELVDPLLDRLSALRSRVKESTETVDAIRTRVEQIASGESLEERLSRLAQLTLRVVATLGEIDSRLRDAADGLDSTRTRADEAQKRVARYILIAEIGAMLLIVWMAAGQVYLARHGWTEWRTTSSDRA